jgi:hypothetical protein
MSKIIKLMLTITAFSLIFVGCGKKAENQSDPIEEQTTQQTTQQTTEAEAAVNEQQDTLNNALAKYTEDDLARCGIVTASVYGAVISDLGKNLEPDVLAETKKMATVLDLNLQVIKYVRDHKIGRDQLLEKNLSEMYSVKFRPVSAIDLMNIELQSCYELSMPLIKPLSRSGAIKMNDYS